MGILIDRDNRLKLYLQLSDILIKRIESEEWPIGSQIPTEEELCKAYDVSRATVRGAISELTRDGYLMKQQGKGTFVIKKVVADKLTMVASFDELMVDPSYAIKTTVLVQTLMMPVDNLAEILDIAPDKHLIYIKMGRFVENILILIQESFIPLHLCPHLLREDLENISLFEFFEKRAGLHITHLKNNFEITHLSAEDAKLFEYPVGTPALMLAQQFYSGGSKIMFNRSVKRPGRLGFSVDFDKKLS
ncbi:MAG TPA: GntR family transcriptional regulator [Dissulfurispiraceae bacterium]|nr:GntR family transcriptional regulator [Dissulfurispiraceae bacterium]